MVARPPESVASMARDTFTDVVVSELPIAKDVMFGAIESIVRT